MTAQRLDAGKAPGQLSFAKRRVDFPVADVMQQHHWPPFAAAQFGHQMVQALRHIRRDGSVTERADRNVCVISHWIDPGRTAAMSGQHSRSSDKEFTSW